MASSLLGPFLLQMSGLYCSLKALLTITEYFLLYFLQAFSNNILERLIPYWCLLR